IAVAEACRNVTCTGAEPVALTDCLNFGNPERPGVYYQLEECIRGMAEACGVLGVPVISGNVSLYNEARGEPIYPTPVVGMLGLLEDLQHVCNMGFRDTGDVVVLLGGKDGEVGLGGSEYLEVVHGMVAGRPRLDLDMEKRVQECCLFLIQSSLVKSAHDCSLGGLAVALALCGIRGGIGFEGRLGGDMRWDGLLFGEGQSRIVLSMQPDNLEAVKEAASRTGVSLKRLGMVRRDRFVIEGLVDLPLADMASTWSQGLSRALE
ncbi:MAG: AIR synthase related protein, partial [Dehalococcoidia bacterium]